MAIDADQERYNHPICFMERPIHIHSASRVRTALVLFLLLMLLVAIVSCNEGPGISTAKKSELTPENETERTALRRELKQLQASIDKELEKVRESFDVVDKGNRDELFYADRKLKSNRAKLEKTLIDIENSNDKTWESLRETARKTTVEIDASFNQIAYQHEDLLNEK
jgi:hypothetical protein